MKAEFLKMAKCKTEKQFYAKYPTEAAFFKAHPSAKKGLKKAQNGVAAAMGAYSNNMQNIPDIQDMSQSPGVNANMFPANDYNQMYMNMSPTDEQLQQPIDYNKQYMNMSTADEQLKQPGQAKPSFGEQLSKMGGPAGKIIGGIQAIKEEKKKRKEAEMWANVSEVQAQASETQDVDDYRQYADNAKKRRNAFMPVTTGEEFFPVQGVGTNVLARNGVRLRNGGNPTEIQNTYDPNDIYDDLEYEPLYDENQVKQFIHGGNIHKAQFGAATFPKVGETPGGGTPWGMIGDIGSMGAAGLTGNDGGGQIGGAVGETAGSFFGPVGGAVGKAAGTLIGGLFDTNDRDQRKAEDKSKFHGKRMLASQFRNNLQGKHDGSLEYGGNVNPQIISEFGNNSMTRLLSPPNDADMLRAGGHIRGGYTQPSAEALTTLEEGGDLSTHWGGYAESMSHNPYLPDSGETVMFRGQSHDESDGKGNTGIGITFGDSPVEVERGEPAVKLKDGGTGEENLTVYGNLMIPKYGIEMLGDKNAKGKKFKNYVADLSKVEKKQNNLIEKSTENINSLDVKNSFDKLKMTSLEASIKGANMKLKDIADKKIKAAELQGAINDTAEEYGLVADDLAKGKFKQDKNAMKEYAKFGTSVPKAQGGIKTTFNTEKEAFDAGYKKIGNEYIKAKQSIKKTSTEKKSADAMDNIPAQKYDKSTGLAGNVTAEKFEEFKNRFSDYPGIKNLNPKDPTSLNDFKKWFNSKAEETGSKARILDDPKTKNNPQGLPIFGEQYLSSNLNSRNEESPIGQFEIETAEVKPISNTKEIPYKRSGLIDFANQLLPYIRPTDQEELNPNQLMGEMYAMSNNQLEPVQATPYSPQLRVPYDISRQAAKNDLISQTRGAQRLVGYNPAAQASIAAQAYDPMQQLNEQDFIDNQRMKDQVYSGNIQTLNDAELKNLDIYDRQYGRQEQAKSNTKATAQAVLNSISDKYAKNALENKTLGVMENMYNYRYDSKGRAINMNPLFQPNIPYIYDNNGKATHKKIFDKDGKTILGYEPVSEKETIDIPSEATTPINSDTNIISQNVATEDYSPIDENNMMYQERNGGKTKKKKYTQSSIVRAFK